MKHMQDEMSFWSHLGELRRRLIQAFLGLFVGFFACYAFRKQIFSLLRIPYDQAFYRVYGQTPTLQTLTLLEGFMVYFKVAILASFFVASPWIFYQLWLFIAPALKPKEKKHIVPFICLATLFFSGGALFGYYIIFPTSFEFFLNITKGQAIQTTVRMQEYYSLASWMLMAFGCAFIVPLIVLYLAYFGILTPKQIRSSWRGVIIGIFISAAIITPTPDVGTMMLMALPMCGLYGLTILLSLTFERKHQKSRMPTR